jgi:hypothetical protein
MECDRPARERTQWNAVPATIEDFKKCAAGHCFRCLARDHQVADCHDPFKCIRCFASGHRVHHCRSVRPAATAHRQPTTSPAIVATPPPSLSSMSSHRLVLHDRGKLGLPSNRVDRVETVAESSAELIATKNDFHSRGVIAIKV